MWDGSIGAPPPLVPQGEIIDNYLRFLEPARLSTIYDIAISPDGDSLASGSDDHVVRLWDVASGILKQTLEGHTDSVESVAFSPDGHTLATVSSDRTARLWDVASGTPQANPRRPYGFGRECGVFARRPHPGHGLFGPNGAALVCILWSS